VFVPHAKGVHQIRLGYVSRVRSRDPSSHVILVRNASRLVCLQLPISDHFFVFFYQGAQLYKTSDFAKQINLSTRKACLNRRRLETESNEHNVAENMWGIVQHFVNVVRARENGTYVLVCRRTI
jgi:hypothetical protein